jgi:hypothetical protein
MRKVVLICAVALLVVGLIGPAASAATRHGTRTGVPTLAATDVERHGSCSGSSRWDLELDTEGARITVDFEVDTAQAGTTWHVTLKHNGTAFFTGNRVTDHEGEFDVERSTPNASGTDYYRARATQAASGEVCVGKASI